MLFSIKATVDRIEGSKAILVIEENPKQKLPQQEIIWPKDELPPTILEGDFVILGILKESEATKSKEESARLMLAALLDKYKHRHESSESKKD